MTDLELFADLRQEASADYQQRQELTGPTKLGIAILVLAVASTLLLTAVPTLAQGLGWAGLLGIGGLWVAGSAGWAWATYGPTAPGIRHDGVYFERTKNVGVFTVLVTIALCTVYCTVWWSNHGDWMVYLTVATALTALWVYGKRQEVRYAGSVALLLVVGWLWFADLTPSALDGVNPLTGLIALFDPLSRAMSGQPADKWFAYTSLYCAAVGLMGIRMFWKYRHSRYHLVRTASVVFFQLGFGFIVPFLLKGAGQKEFYFHYFWPLKPEYLLPFSIESGFLTYDAIGRAMLLWTVLLALVGVPILTWAYGKRWYCSWVCGCGALAETAGDPWRQHSDKSESAWRVERVTVHGVLLAIVVITVALWTHELAGRPYLSDGGSQVFWAWYGFFITAGFSGVIGTGFYPVLGGRIWCRFGCPQAAILGLLQRYLSRFRITTNGDQCISCGNCSTYCEMGIDVRAYAQRGDNIVRASCVGCGVCAAVCPRGVLKLENGPVTDRFDGADEPLQEFLRSLGVRPRK
jgi:Pyruvate/2-oxoacid:ferredoxin oxidoreductase delta subunit